jgi:uncharacterized protein (UPF0276 family)
MSDSDTPWVGLSLMLEDDFRRAALPLFEGGDVEVLEWSFDVGWGNQGMPAWSLDLVDFYGRQGRLLGHGVTYSALSGHWTARQQQWLDRLDTECRRRSYRHISEHFGFMTAGDFHRSAPLPVPRTEGALRIGQDRLQRLAETAQVPVGLENLAFAFGTRDVAEQGQFLEQLLAPVDGFLLLDLHNIYCQMCNFDVPADELLAGYPLQRVRELHVSGGSYSESSVTDGHLVRRDTHDDAVPQPAFELVELALGLCPQVEAVILERLGGTISAGDDAQFRADFHRLVKTVEDACHATG